MPHNFWSEMWEVPLVWNFYGTLMSANCLSLCLNCEYDAFETIKLAFFFKFSQLHVTIYALGVSVNMKSSNWKRMWIGLECIQNVARIRWHMWKFLFYCMLSLTHVQKTQAQPFGVLVVLSVTQDFVQILILLIFMSSQITIYNGALLPSILMVIIIFLLKTSRCLYGQPVQFWHLLPHIHVFVVLFETCLLPGHSIS